MEIPLKEYLEQFATAKNPIDHKLLQFIPFFEEVFDRDIWSTLARLSGKSGIALIEKKVVKPGELIIKKGAFDMMVYWLLKGRAEIVALIDKKSTVVKKLKETGQCFGELAVLSECERNADVVVSRGSDPVIVLEIDWSITNICRELDAKFSKLMLKTITRKLNESYSVVKTACSAIKRVNQVSESQSVEIGRLKSLLSTSDTTLI